MSGANMTPEDQDAAAVEQDRAPSGATEGLTRYEPSLEHKGLQPFAAMEKNELGDYYSKDDVDGLVAAKDAELRATESALAACRKVRSEETLEIAQLRERLARFEQPGTRWHIMSGPDGFMSKIVIGQEALERAFLECIYGEPAPDLNQVNAEEMEIRIAALRDPDEWLQGDGVGSVAYDVSFEDGWICIVRLPEVTL